MTLRSSKFCSQNNTILDQIGKIYRGHIFFMYLDSFCRWDVKMFSWSLNFISTCVWNAVLHPKLKQNWTVNARHSAVAVCHPALWMELLWHISDILQAFQKVWSAFQNSSKPTQTSCLGAFYKHFCEPFILIAQSEVTAVQLPRAVLLWGWDAHCLEDGSDILRSVWFSWKWTLKEKSG